MSVPSLQFCSCCELEVAAKPLLPAASTHPARPPARPEFLFVSPMLGPARAHVLHQQRVGITRQIGACGGVMPARCCAARRPALIRLNLGRHR